MDKEDKLLKYVGDFYLGEKNLGSTGELVGSGGHGGAFDVVGSGDNLVVKVTTSDIEAGVVKRRLLNHNKEGIIKYYDIMKINVADNVQKKFNVTNFDELYCITMEKINTKSCWIRPVFYIIHRDLKNGKVSKGKIIQSKLLKDPEVQKLLERTPIEYKKLIIESIYDNIYDVINDYDFFFDVLPDKVIKIYKKKLRLLYIELKNKLITYRKDIINKPFSNILNKDNIRELFGDNIESIQDYVDYSEDEVVELIISVVKMMDDVVSLGIVNRDMNPDNIGIKDKKFVIFDIMDTSMVINRDECENLSLKEQIKEAFFSILHKN